MTSDPPPVEPAPPSSPDDFAEPSYRPRRSAEGDDTADDVHGGADDLGLDPYDDDDLDESTGAHARERGEQPPSWLTPRRDDSDRYGEVTRVSPGGATAWSSSNSPDAAVSAESPAPAGDGFAAGTDSATIDAAASGRPTHGRRELTTGDYVRAGVRGLGQTLVTLGLVVLLFVVYEVYVTNITADAHQRDVKNEYAQAVKSRQDPLKGQDKIKLPAGKQVILPAGQGFANLYIPRLGKDFAKTIVQGTRESDLDKGPGHYAGTAVPGQIGNFAMAGHRVGKGEPFLNLDQLAPGDAVVVQTASHWYVYRVLGDAKTGELGTVDNQGVPGREIVAPSQTRVIAPVPDHVGAKPTRALLTMTTCHPKYTADKRMIVHAVLTRGLAVKAGQRPKELGGTL